MTNRTWDVIIVGGGIMGCSIAYHLVLADKTLRVAVFERDPTYTCASSTLSVGNIRSQFSLKENILISQYASRVLERFEDDMMVEGERPSIVYRKEGNLFLVNSDGYEGAQRALILQEKLDCHVEWWSPEKIRKSFPLYEPGLTVGGTYGPDDGYIDAYALLMGYKAKARSLGVSFMTDEVTKIDSTRGRVSGVTLASGGRINAGLVINCAGAWAADVARTAGVKLPVVPVKRQVFVLDTAVKPAGSLPLTILPSGLYFRTETGGLILLGKSMPEDPTGFDFSWDEKRFMEVLWPELVTCVPAFDRLKLVRGWAGLYAVNTLDGNAVLGEWPELKGFFLANGFSGHGLQQSPAVGRYLTELILGRRPQLDLSVFWPERILENKPLVEGGLV